jgi:agmatinase
MTWGGRQVVDAGDIAVNPFSIDEAIATIESQTRELLSVVEHLVVIGGDHTIALPLLRIVAERHGPIALVHFDAHLDTWDTYFGAPYTHGTPFRRAAEEGLFAPSTAVHVGVRGSLYGSTDLIEDSELGFKVISTADVARAGTDEVVTAILDRVGNHPVYVSIDIDVLDPAHAPGTGTPEPGGLTSRELQFMLRGMAECNLVGGDVVEVSPSYDHAELTALAAANMAYELIGILAK